MENIETQLNEMSIINTDEQSIEYKWGWPLKDLYRSSLAFYKGNYSTFPVITLTCNDGSLLDEAVSKFTEKSGKAVQFTYEDNLKLVAFCQQALHGPVTDSLPPIGAFDVIGRDRRVAWQTLGNISKSQAMEGFIDLLDRLCPSFHTYIEAIKKDKEAKERLANEAEQQRLAEREIERQREIDRKLMEEQKSREELQKRKLQDLLNQQTYLQFRAYADKQFPGNPEQQAVLIRQLQNEHYHQYMQQLHAQMATEQNDNNASEQTNGNECDGNGLAETGTANNCNLSQKECAQIDEKEECNSENESNDGFPPIAPASMWTKADIEQFKTEVAAGKGEGVIKVGHGDIVTVRVPTHDGGSCLFWEFATDSYDIGFGVYFEWGKQASHEVSVQVCDTDDEEDDDEEVEFQTSNDLESGVTNEPVTPPSPVSRYRPPMSSVVPVYRRDCQTEVYVGSHNYPGEGCYLLKFDNSYSLWRSKTLYYRVFYTR